MPFFKTVKDGYWNDPEVWDLGRVPGSGDVIDIYHHVKLHPDQEPLKGGQISLKSATAALDLNGVKATAISAQMPGAGRVVQSAEPD